MRKPVLFTVFSLLCLTQTRAGEITIKYTINKIQSDSSKPSLYEEILDIVRNSWDPIDPDNRVKLPSKRQLIGTNAEHDILAITYTIDRDGIYFITDLFGHEVFLDKTMVNDTIELILDKVRLEKNRLLYLNDSIVSPWFYKISYPAKYCYMGFFDSLTKDMGDLKSDLSKSYYPMRNDFKKYLQITTESYRKRRIFLDGFLQSCNIPDPEKDYASKEIQYRYYHDVLDPLTQNASLKKEYSQDLLDTIATIGTHLNDNELFRNITFYRLVVLDYVFSGGPEISQKQKFSADSNYVIDRLAFCNAQLKGESKGYALAWLLRLTSHNGAKELFEKVFSSYEPQNSSAGLNEYAVSLHKLMIEGGHIPAVEMLAMSFEDSAHTSRKLGALFTKKLILIDCWATWCGPCRQQAPSLDSLADEYKDRVQFIAISADQFRNKWDIWLAASHSSDTNIMQLHAAKGFEHAFFTRLLISTIPRYILVSKSGEILNYAMPYPGETAEFKKILLQYLN